MSVESTVGFFDLADHRLSIGKLPGSRSFKSREQDLLSDERPSSEINNSLYSLKDPSKEM
jgi:hypothetical protein